MRDSRTGDEKLLSDCWMRGVQHEVVFWDSRLTKKRRKRIEKRFENAGSLDLDFFTQEQIINHLSSQISNIVLDVGCGMSFRNASCNSGDVPIDIHYVDPLATFYNSIIEKNNMKVPQIEFGFVEYLSSFYAQNSIPLIIIQNALDHSFNPVKGIIECVNCLSLGGVLYLAHNTNVGETQNYEAFHQANIAIQNNSAIVWGNDYSVNINELLEDVASVVFYEDGKLNYIIITKTNDASHLLSLNNDVKSLCSQLMRCVEMNMRGRFTYNIRKAKSRLYIFLKGMQKSVVKKTKAS